MKTCRTRSSSPVYLPTSVIHCSNNLHHARNSQKTLYFSTKASAKKTQKKTFITAKEKQEWPRTQNETQWTVFESHQKLFGSLQKNCSEPQKQPRTTREKYNELKADGEDFSKHFLVLCMTTGSYCWGKNKSCYDTQTRQGRRRNFLPTNETSQTRASCPASVLHCSKHPQSAR